MKIDGKEIASELFQNLQARVGALKGKKVTPHIAILLVGDNPASVSYVKRKQLKAEELGAKATVINYELRITNEELREKIHELNTDNNVHGIIVQRPLPPHIDADAVNQAVIPSKDIDAFHSHTPFVMPLAKATLLLLENVYYQSSHFADAHSNNNAVFYKWLQPKKVVVVGKGETGGGPIITLLKKHGVTPQIIDSKTEDITNITKQADIIISAVGKQAVITTDMIKKDVILISVGQHKEADGKFHGDYEHEAIETIASYYSPTPGGVGPVNVICLLENLILAAERMN